MTRQNDKAIVTLLVGDEYIANFKKHFLPSLQAYGERHGYDIVILTQLLDPGCDFSVKSIHWQKLLVGLHPDVKQYEKVVWLDGDIIINVAQAPCLLSSTPLDKIAVAREESGMTTPDNYGTLHTRFLILRALSNYVAGDGQTRQVIAIDDVEAWYRFAGFEGAVTRHMNTGVFAFRPEAHAEFLAGVYAKYPQDSVDYENSALSFELQDREMYELIDGRFNAVWATTAARHYPFLFDPEADPALLAKCVNAAYQNSWFMHFSGSADHPVSRDAFGSLDCDVDGTAELVFPEEWQKRSDFMHFVTFAGCRALLRDLDEKGIKRDFLF